MSLDFEDGSDFVDEYGIDWGSDFGGGGWSTGGGDVFLGDNPPTISTVDVWGTPYPDTTEIVDVQPIQDWDSLPFPDGYRDPANPDDPCADPATYDPVLCAVPTDCPTCGVPWDGSRQPGAGGGVGTQQQKPPEQQKQPQKSPFPWIILLIAVYVIART